MIGTRGARLISLILACAVALIGCEPAAINPERLTAAPTPSAVLGTPVVATATLAPTPTPPPPSATPLPPTPSPLPPTETPLPPTPSPLMPTETPLPPTPSPLMPTGTPARSAAEALEQEVLALLNVARAEAGCAVPLSPAAALTAAAQRHSDDMAAGDFVGHAGSDGSDAGRRIEEAGYRFGAVAPGKPLWAENVAAGFADPAAVVESWLASPGHRANIVTCGFTQAGIALAARDGSRYTTYWTNVFAVGP